MEQSQTEDTPVFFPAGVLLGKSGHSATNELQGDETSIYVNGSEPHFNLTVEIKKRHKQMSGITCESKPKKH